MTIYTDAEVREQLPALLEKALAEGQVKFKSRDGRVFVIRPARPPKTSPFDVRSVRLPITKRDILEAIRESRARL
ncbi:MAG: hypothetical protein NZM11_00240 [Anaerolineales bacterium]|nr:hypothetical protein [Anaerolineales bacterium]